MWELLSENTHIGQQNATLVLSAKRPSHSVPHMKHQKPGLADSVGLKRHACNTDNTNMPTICAILLLNSIVNLTKYASALFIRHVTIHHNHPQVLAHQLHATEGLQPYHQQQMMADHPINIKQVRNNSSHHRKGYVLQGSQGRYLHIEEDHGVVQ